MSKHDVVVVGGGISGLSFAFEAGRAGRTVLVLEKEARPGGCLATRRAGSGYWFELGAHTCYNSYASFTALLEACGLRDDVQARAKTHLRFLDGDRLVPGSNLGVLLRLFSWPEAAVSLPRMLGATKDGRTVAEFYGRIVGKGNYARVLGPMLSAVPSQSADAFPAGMLFKSRDTRRKDFPRSFTLRDGLQSAADALAKAPKVEVATGRTATSLAAAGSGWVVTTDDGERHEAGLVALATPPGTASALLAQAAPELSEKTAGLREAVVESLGFAVRASKVSRIPVSMFLVPKSDAFHSIVTRDSVPDADWRAFSFHYKPGLAAEGRLARAAQVLGLGRGDLEEVSERRTVLPSPVLGHEAVVAEVDRLLAGKPLALLGNWFAGLSIEDCVDRSRLEWRRVGALAG